MTERATLSLWLQATRRATSVVVSPSFLCSHSPWCSPLVWGPLLFVSLCRVCSVPQSQEGGKGSHLLGFTCLSCAEKREGYCQMLLGYVGTAPCAWALQEFATVWGRLCASPGELILDCDTLGRAEPFRVPGNPSAAHSLGARQLRYLGWRPSRLLPSASGPLACFSVSGALGWSHISHLRVSSRQQTLVLSMTMDPWAVRLPDPAPIRCGWTWVCEPCLGWEVPFAWSLWWMFAICLRSTCLAALPSEVQKLPLPPPVSGFPSVWELFHLQDSLPGAQVPPLSPCCLYLLPHLIPGRLVWLSEGLGSSASVQKLFYGNCSTCRWFFSVFIGENVVSPSYYSTIWKVPHSCVLKKLSLQKSVERDFDKGS